MSRYILHSALDTDSAKPSEMLSGCPMPLRSTSSTRCFSMGVRLTLSTDDVLAIFLTAGFFAAVFLISFGHDGHIPWIIRSPGPVLSLDWTGHGQG